MCACSRLAVLLTAFAFFTRSFAASPPAPVSTAGSTLVANTGAAGSLGPLLSADGQFVVFSSLAADLVTNDLNNALDVFLFDAETRQLSLVSLNAAGTRSAAGRSVAVGISTNGQWIAFESAASDIVTNDSDNVPDLFLHDRVSGETRLVSANRFGTPVGGFRNASLSPDGRFLLFESAAPGLVTNNCTSIQVYLRDLQAGSNVLVSVSTNADTSGNGVSGNAAMTPDARWVAFQSRANSLAANDTNYFPDIYLRDMRQGTTVLVSADASGASSTNSTAASINPCVSDDGHFVVFESTATTLSPDVPPGTGSAVYLRDVIAGTNLFVSGQSDDGSAVWPVVSGDGRFVAYQSATNLYCWDIARGASFLLSTNFQTAQGANGPSHSPQFTPGSHYCLFLSSATDLVPNGAGLGQYRVYRRDMETGETLLVGPASGSGAVDGGWSCMSDTGNVVAFQSSDPEWAANDFNAAPDIFVSNIAEGTTSLASTRHPSVTAATAGARSAVRPNCLSADSRYLLFSSFAANVWERRTSGQQNLYVRDLWTGSNQLVTASWSGDECANGEHYAASLSGDGRWAAFQSSATNLVANDTNNVSDIFVRDLRARTNYLVSVPRTGAGFANHHSMSPAISDDGRFITFQSLASNLAANDTASTLDAFLRDMEQRTNITLSARYVSPIPYGGQTNAGNGAYNPFTPRLTPNGGWAVIWSRSNLSTNANFASATPYCFARNREGRMVAIGVYTNASLYAANRWLTIAPGGQYAVFGVAGFYNMIGVYDFVHETNCLAVNATSGNASISADGRWLAFEGRASTFGTNSGNSVSDIFLLDRANNAVRLASFNPTTLRGGNGPSTDPILSADGRYLIFKSAASDLVTGDTNGVSDLFVRDLTAGTTFALSCDPAGTPGNRVSGNAILGPDGRTLVFESFASNLLAGDLNETRDVFVLRLPGDAVDAFRIVSLSSPATGRTTLFWNSIPGKTYGIEYCANLASANWTELPGQVTATAYTCSITDIVPGGGTRFYRVRLMN